METLSFPDDQDNRPPGGNQDANGDAYRWQLGLVIATQGGIQRRGGNRFLVPFQSGRGRYTVTLGPPATCTCPDFELRRRPCKHVHAAGFVQRVDTDALRSAAPSASLLDMAPPPSTPRDWSVYNACQTNEVKHFTTLLRSLCDTVPELPAASRGRPRMPMSDALFCLGLRTYYRLPARRLIPVLDDARERGLLGHVPSFGVLYRYMEDPRTALLLRYMVESSALPLASVEKDFAIDSTAFPTSSPVPVKLHAVCGVRTNAVTAVSVTPYNSGDSPNFRPLVGVTATNFNIQEISADKAYLDHRSLEFAEEIGAQAFIPFKVDSRRVPAYGKPNLTWERAYHFFHFNRERFLASYHKRSNVETSFQMIKERFGRRVRSRTPAARMSEILLRVLCHNVCCLVRASYELDIGPILDA